MGRPRLECCGQSGPPQFGRDIEGLQQAQGRAAGMGKILEHKSCKEWGVFSLEKRSLRGGLINLCKSLTRDRWGLVSSPRQPVIRQQDIILNCTRAGLG